jgi:hypothetical protein
VCVRMCVCQIRVDLTGERWLVQSMERFSAMLWLLLSNSAPLDFF